MTGLLYFAAGVLAGGTLGAVIGAVIATTGMQKQQDRQVDGPHAAWTRPRRLVCLACRLGIGCHEHGTPPTGGAA